MASKIQAFLRVGTLLIATNVAMFAAASARADWYFPLVRITCIPEASYAAVETFGLYNIGDAVLPASTALEIRGIHELRSLAEKTVTCTLPQGTLQIEVLNYHAPRAKGECGGVEDADLNVSLAGTQLVLVKGTHGGCNGIQRHDIRISEYELDHCILRFDQPAPLVKPGYYTPVATTCKTLPLR